MRRLLVTGGAGFIGTNFVYHWQQRYPADRLVVLDLLTYAGNRANLAPLESNSGFRFVHGDICDVTLVRKLFADENIDTVVHFAAESHVDRSIADPGVFLRTNILGTQVLLDEAREHWRDKDAGQVRLHHVSTDEVFGSLGKDAPAFTEQTPYAPNSPYAASKAGADHLVRAYHRTYGLPITISNCSNNYGPWQFPEKLLPLMIMHALTGKPLPVYGNGSNVRDWLFVEDHCSAIACILEKGRVGETYNVGGNCERDNLSMVRMLCARLDELCPQSPYRPHAERISFVTDRPGHDFRYATDISKISTELGWEPSESLETGLRKTVGWYLQNYRWC
ncbi:MAG: dTDP-glucose 4,6-dehydratase [Gammaproteobacteria bacterium]